MVNPSALNKCYISYFSLQDARSAALSELAIELSGGQFSVTKLEDLQLTFQYAPSSAIFGAPAQAVIDLGKI